MYLLDTNVLQELRRRPEQRDPTASRWLSLLRPGESFLSTITILEIERGVRLKERVDPRQGAVLRRWLESQILPAFEGRVLPVDVSVARCAAGLHAPDPLPAYDALIAATAIVHDATLVTRNVRDFTTTPTRLLNPWHQ